MDDETERGPEMSKVTGSASEYHGSLKIGDAEVFLRRFDDDDAATAEVTIPGVGSHSPARGRERAADYLEACQVAEEFDRYVDTMIENQRVSLPAAIALVSQLHGWKVERTLDDDGFVTRCRIHQQRGGLKMKRADIEVGGIYATKRGECVVALSTDKYEKAEPYYSWSNKPMKSSTGTGILVTELARSRSDVEEASLEQRATDAVITFDKWSKQKHNYGDTHGKFLALSQIAETWAEHLARLERQRLAQIERSKEQERRAEAFRLEAIWVDRQNEATRSRLTQIGIKDGVKLPQHGRGVSVGVFDVAMSREAFEQLLSKAEGK